MPRTVALIFAVLAQTLPLVAQEQTPAIEMREAGDVQLDEFMWTARTLVIFADAPADPRFSEQVGLLTADIDALLDRDVVIVTDTSPADQSDARTQLRPRGFMLALLAKDGSVVFRKPLPWDVREISRAIDKLPLRKQELSQMRSGSN